MPYQPRPARIRVVEEPRELRSDPLKLTGSQRENARRYLSGELIRALGGVEKYWRPGYDNPSLLAEGGSSSEFKLVGPGRAPPLNGPDFYTLRFKTRPTLIGAESGVFHLHAHQLVMREEAFDTAVAHLRAEGLCCENCAEHPRGPRMFSKTNEHGLPKGERCYLNEVIRNPLGLWVTQAFMVVKAKDVPDEYVRVALTLFDRAVAYPIDNE
jgi:hypothetical protein